jgi:cytochrome c553
MNDNLASLLRRSAICGGLLSAAILLGCSSGDDGTAAAAGSMNNPATAAAAGGNMTGGAKDVFTKELWPLFASCTSCHATGQGGAPKYLGNSAEEAYTQVKNIKSVYTLSANSTLIQKTSHATNALPVLDSAGKAIAKKWLDLEFPPSMMVENPPAMGNPNPNSGSGFNQAIQEFIKCMDQDDWEQNMKFYPMLQTVNFGPCAGCHEDGNGGTFLNADFNVTFEAMRTVPYVFRLVTAVYEGGKISALEENERLISKGQISTDCFDPNNLICHDLYNVPKDQSEGLKTFQQRTLGRIDANLKCGGIF